MTRNDQHQPTPANPLAKETTVTSSDQPKKAELSLLERLDAHRRMRTAHGATLAELELLEEREQALKTAESDRDIAEKFHAVAVGQRDAAWRELDRVTVARNQELATLEGYAAGVREHLTRTPERNPYAVGTPEREAWTVAWADINRVYMAGIEAEARRAALVRPAAAAAEAKGGE